MLLFFSGCREKVEHLDAESDVIAINRQLSVAMQSGLADSIRLDSAKSAFDAAVKLDSAFLIYTAFNAKYQLLQQTFPEKSTAFLNNYKKLSQQKHDTLNLAVALFETGKQHAKKRPDSAYFYYNAARILCEARHDSLGVVEKITNMAYLHYRYNDFAEFENTTTEGLKFLPKVPKTNLDSVYLAYAYNNYGLAYGSMSQEPEAVRAYKKAYALNTDTAFRNSVLNNLSLAYTSNGNYTEATNILNGLLKSESLLSDKTLQATVTDNLGYNYFRVGDSEALGYLQKAATVRKSQLDDYGAIASQIHLAEYYLKKEPLLFKKYALEAYEKATYFHSTNDRLKALRLLSQISGSEGRKFASSYIALNDSIDKVQQNAKNQFAKIKYDSKSATEENLKLKAQQAEKNLQIEQQKNAGLAIVLAALITAGIAVYIYFRSESQKRKTVHETETRIAKQLHDELANDLHHTMTLVDSLDTAVPLEKENFLRNLEKLYQRTRNISKENQDIDTGIAFPQILKEKIGDYQNEQVNVISSGIEDIPWDVLSRDKKIAVHRIIQEWLVNMKKHSQCNIVVIRFEKQRKNVKISYKDNGVGMGEKSIILKGGLQNVETRIRAIKGTVIFGHDSATGFYAEITFPI